MGFSREHLRIRVLYWIVFSAIVALVVYAAYTLFLPVFFGFLLAFLIDPIVDWLERRGWSRPMASMLLFALLFAGFVFLLVGLVPRLEHQVSEVSARRADYANVLDARVSQVRETALRYLSKDMVTNAEASARGAVAHKLQAVQEQAPGMLAGVAHVLAEAIFVPIIAFFFLVEGSEIKKFVIRLLPNRYFEMTLMMMHQVNFQLGSYLRGQAMDCLLNGSLYAMGLMALGVKGGAVIGGFAGLMNAIPYVGPILGVIPAMFSLMMDPAATMPWWSAAVLFLCVHLLDDVLIYPMTVGKSLNLPPFVVILGILFGGSVAGIPGMFLTVPLLGMAKQIFIVFHQSLRSYKII